VRASVVLVVDGGIAGTGWEELGDWLEEQPVVGHMQGRARRHNEACSEEPGTRPHMEHSD
jgi:hypothetical protein